MEASAGTDGVSEPTVDDVEWWVGWLAIPIALPPWAPERR